MKLADNIIRLRRLRGWSQEELAERLGVSRQSVSKWEGEQSQPDLPRVVEMSRIFGVSTDCLLGLSELPDSCSGTPSQPEQAPEQGRGPGPARFPSRNCKSCCGRGTGQAG